MNAREYEAARQRYEQAIDGCRAARERVTEANRGIDRAEDELAAANRDLRQYEQAPGIPLPQWREHALVSPFASDSATEIQP